MARLLIITGPQGSGNHLFSKIFALHDEVFGWKNLLNTYWEGHHHEPFADCWQDPDKLHAFDWKQSEYFVTSVSCPFVKDQVPHVPDYKKFIDIANVYADVELCIIGRDQNILEYQQKRVRGNHTAPLAIEAFNSLLEEMDATFLSQELLYLYKDKYLQQLTIDLQWPIAYYDPEIAEILKADANRKYVKDVHEYWLDFEVHRAIRES